MNNEFKWIWQEVVVTWFHIVTLRGICLEEGAEENHKTLVRVAAVFCQSSSVPRGVDVMIHIQ
jgi:hypothetical protein